MDTNNIKQLDGERVRLEARVSKFDKKEGFAGPQRIVCLKNIRIIDSDNAIFNSLWVNCGKWSSILQVNDNIIFDARINLKKKQKIERITKVSVIDKDIIKGKISDQERDLIEKAERYGRNLWERTECIDQIIVAIEDMGEVWNQRSWTSEHDKNLEQMACKIVHSEWNTKTEGIMSRLHEFIVWLKLMINPSIQNVDPMIQKQFYRLCIEQWFYFYQGE